MPLPTRSRRTPPSTGRRARPRGRRLLYLVLAGVALLNAAGRPAWAYWTDTGTVSGGSISTWSLEGVSCPNPNWGSNQALSWTALAGTSYTVSVALDSDSPTLGTFDYWVNSLQPDHPVTTTSGTTAWGIGTSNPWPSADFHGTWQLVATAPGGIWTATRSGTWTIHYTSIASGSAACAVNP